MQLPAIAEREVAAPTQARWAVDGIDAEGTESAEVALDGMYLLPGTLFEADKSLFDLGMLNLFGTLAAGARRNTRCGFPCLSDPIMVNMK